MTDIIKGEKCAINHSGNHFQNVNGEKVHGTQNTNAIRRKSWW